MEEPGPMGESSQIEEDGFAWLRGETRRLADSIEEQVHESWRGFLLGVARPLSGGVELLHRRLEDLQDRLEEEVAEARRLQILAAERAERESPEPSRQ